MGAKRARRNVHVYVTPYETVPPLVPILKSQNGPW